MTIAAIMNSIRDFLFDEGGPTAVEYSVMLMLVLLVCLTTIQLVGGWCSGSLEDSATKINEATGS
jgi:pilus assembly protein Flp/PilA